MAFHHQYLVIPAPDAPNLHGCITEPVWCSSFGNALYLADGLVKESGMAHYVMTWECAVVAPEPVSLEEEYGVKPGEDFPGTLQQYRG